MVLRLLPYSFKVPHVSIHLSTIHHPLAKNSRKNFNWVLKNILTTAHLLDHRVLPLREGRRVEGKGEKEKGERGKEGMEEFKGEGFLVFHCHTHHLEYILQLRFS